MSGSVVTWRHVIGGVARLMGVGVIGLGLAACGPPPDPLAPPEIRYGEDVCVECNMIISEPRFAAGMVVEWDGRNQALAFDDVGDLLAYEGKQPGLVVQRRYVHDYDTEDWLPADEATFVQSSAIRSPMGHGLAAFAAADRAAAFAKEVGGKVLTWDVLSPADGGGTQP